MSTKLKIGLVGCGRISLSHLSAIKKNLYDLDLIAVCDFFKDKADSFSKLASDELGIMSIKPYSDWRLMIKENNLDLVVVCTESGSHAEISIECLNNNINVIVEKPMALSIEDADKMISIADKNGLKLGVSLQNRFNKGIKKLKETIDNGKFGKLIYGTAQVRWYRGEDYYNQASWRGTWKSDGGTLMNQCIHNVDLLSWMFGDVQEVFAYTDNLRHPNIQTEDFGMALLKFKNGVYGIVEGTVNIYSPTSEENLFIFGEKGTVKIGGECVNKIDCWKFEGEIDTDFDSNNLNEFPPNVYGFGHVDFYTNMINAIKNNERPLIDGLEGKKSLEIILAIYKSSKEKKPIVLPLKKFSTMHMVRSYLPIE